MKTSSTNYHGCWLFVQVLARSRATVSRADGTLEEYKPSVAVVKRLASRWPKPKWHAPWKTYRVISGHLGWVSSLAFDPGNEWFATGSADRTVKIWDMASGQLKLTLTGHTEQVMGLGVSDKFTYMFSCGLDKKVMCWDLETNKVRARLSPVCSYTRFALPANARSSGVSGHVDVCRSQMLGTGDSKLPWPLIGSLLLSTAPHTSSVDNRRAGSVSYTHLTLPTILLV